MIYVWVSVWCTLCAAFHVFMCTSTVNQCFQFTCPHKLLIPHPNISFSNLTPHTSRKAVYCIFYPGAPSSWMSLVKAAQWERRDADGRENMPQGPRCARRARKKERKQRPPSWKGLLFVPKWLIYLPELQWFCTGGSTSPTLITICIQALILWRTLQKMLDGAVWCLRESC